LMQIDLIVPSVPAPGNYSVNFSVGSNFQLGNLRLWVTP